MKQKDDEFYDLIRLFGYDKSFDALNDLARQTLGWGIDEAIDDKYDSEKQRLCRIRCLESGDAIMLLFELKSDGRKKYNFYRAFEVRNGLVCAECPITLYQLSEMGYSFQLYGK